MFEDSLLERRIRTKRGRATVVSFALQVVLVAIVVLLPLMFTQALPTKEMVSYLVAPPPPPPPPPLASTAPSPPTAARAVVTETSPGAIRMPTRIPKKVAMVNETASAAPPPVVGGVPGGMPGGVAGGQIGGVIGGVIGSTNYVPEAPKLNRVRVSQGVSSGLLTHKVEPQYPPLAKQARIQGSVVLHAIIGKDGRIENLQVVQGHPMLSGAAISAVKEWRYKPYYLNGQPVEVETNITVNFKLA